MTDQLKSRSAALKAKNKIHGIFDGEDGEPSTSNDLMDSDSEKSFDLMGVKTEQEVESDLDELGDKKGKRK